MLVEVSSKETEQEKMLPVAWNESRFQDAERDMPNTICKTLTRCQNWNLKCSKPYFDEFRVQESQDKKEKKKPRLCRGKTMFHEVEDRIHCNL